MSTSCGKQRIALIGECLVELNGKPFGPLQQTFGGDTLNTTLYLARVAGNAVDVCYVTALGTDVLSEGMVQRWRAEGIDTELVLRDPVHLPGLYWIQLDEHGERTFQYWRSDSAARYLLQHPQFARVADELAKMHAVYVSGISLAILPAADRARLLDSLQALAARGVSIVFDSNYRPALWPSLDAARSAMQALMPSIRLMLATFDDEQRLWGDATPAATIARLHGAQVPIVVLKMGAAGCRYCDGMTTVQVPTSSVTVVDTTAAGDAFDAGFLSRWLGGATPQECCRAGNVLAGAVIQHRGAIIPATAMPSGS